MCHPGTSPSVKKFDYLRVKVFTGLGLYMAADSFHRPGLMVAPGIDQGVLDALLLKIKEMTATAEVGKVYKGIVTTIKDFGAFVEILPGTDGLVHISELANERVGKVTDVVKEGDEIEVKVLEVDSRVLAAECVIGGMRLRSSSGYNPGCMACRYGGGNSCFWRLYFPIGKRILITSPPCLLGTGRRPAGCTSDWPCASPLARIFQFKVPLSHQG
jgi:S1 RNA binding domain